MKKKYASNKQKAALRQNRTIEPNLFDKLNFSDELILFIELSSKHIALEPIKSIEQNLDQYYNRLIQKHQKRYNGFQTHNKRGKR